MPNSRDRTRHFRRTSRNSGFVERLESLVRAACALALVLAAQVAVTPSVAQDVAERALIYAETPDALASALGSKQRSHGDIIVVSKMTVERPLSAGYRSDRLEQRGDGDDLEPVYLVGRDFFEHVKTLHVLSDAQFKTKSDLRRLLLRPIEAPNPAPTPPEAAGRKRPGIELDRRVLTPLSLEQIRFSSGVWSMSGFDVRGYTASRDMIVVGKRRGTTGRLLFTANRISNCADDLKTCAWSTIDDSGAKRNGGTLILAHYSAHGIEIRGNVFEKLRGFVLISLTNGSRATRVVGNTFRDLLPWAPNGAEAVHIGAGRPVAGPLVEPVFESMHTVVAENLFVRCSAEGELIGVKSGDNRIADNWIIDSDSGISLRDGRDTLVAQNYIVRSYGIRVMGDRQIIRGNTIVQPYANRGIWFENGASRAGVTCAGLSSTQPTVGASLEHRYWWMYRMAKESQVSQNTVIVAEGATSIAIASWDREKSCGDDSCPATQQTMIRCDKLPPEPSHSDLAWGQLNTIINGLSPRWTEPFRHLRGLTR